MSDMRAFVTWRIDFFDAAAFIRERTLSCTKKMKKATATSTFHLLVVCPCVYTLKLQGDDAVEFYVYVGSCCNLNQRLAQHLSGVGARFTREHKMIEIMSVQLVNGDAIAAENARTLEMIAEYGSERVRGGKYLSG